MVTISGSSVLRATGWFTLARLFTAAAAAIAGVIAARELGPSARGEVAVGLLVGYLAAVVSLRGLEKSLAATAPGRSFEETWSLAISFVSRSLVPLVVAMLGGLAVSLAWEAVPPLAVVAVFGLAVGTALTRAAAASGAASADMRRQPVITLVSGAVLIIGALGLLAWGESSMQEWLLLYAIGSLAGVLCARLGRRTANDEAALRASLATQTMSGLTATLTSFLSLRVDRLLIPLLAGTEELGFYVVASTIVDLAATPMKGASQVMVARWSVSGVPGLGSVIAVAGAVASALAAALYLGSLWAIPAVLGSEYQRSLDLLAVLAPALVGYLVARVVVARCLALGATTHVSTAETSGLVVSVAGAASLIPFYGAMGAAVASLVGYATVAVVAVALTRWRNRAPSPSGVRGRQR